MIPFNPYDYIFYARYSGTEDKTGNDCDLYMFYGNVTAKYRSIHIYHDLIEDRWEVNGVPNEYFTNEPIPVTDDERWLMFERVILCKESEWYELDISTSKLYKRSMAEGSYALSFYETKVPMTNSTV